MNIWSGFRAANSKSSEAHAAVLEFICPRVLVWSKRALFPDATIPNLRVTEALTIA